MSKPSPEKRSVKQEAASVEPMLLQRSMNCPTGPSGCAELKLDGYRAVALKTAGQVHLRSRNDNDLDLRYLAIVRAPRIFRTKP